MRRFSRVFLALRPFVSQFMVMLTHHHRVIQQGSFGRTSAFCLWLGFSASVVFSNWWFRLLFCHLRIVLVADWWFDQGLNSSPLFSGGLTNILQSATLRTVLGYFGRNQGTILRSAWSVDRLLLG